MDTCYEVTWAEIEVHSHCPECLIGKERLDKRRRKDNFGWKQSVQCDSDKESRTLCLELREAEIEYRLKGICPPPCLDRMEPAGDRT